MKLIDSYWGVLFEKCGKMWNNQSFFRLAMAGFGKYSMGGYSRIGVYRLSLLYN